MTMKKMSLSAIALTTILLTVGCTSNDNSEQNINMNTEASTETAETIKSKYSNNIEVKAFFDLTENAQDITALEFIDKVKAMDVKKTLTIEKIEQIEESGNDNTQSIPRMNTYKIKPSTNNTELRVLFTEFKDDNHAKKIGFKNHEIYSITLMLPDENLSIMYSTFTNSYSVTLHSAEPIVTKENISEFKEAHDYGEKFLKLQDKLIDNNNMTTEDIEKLWDQKLEPDVEYRDSTWDMPYGDVRSIRLTAQDGTFLSVFLKGKNKDEVLSAMYTGNDASFMYHSKEALSDSETTINDDRFEVSLVDIDKASLISEIEKLYTYK